MTDKQIIIDGLYCDNCPEARRCQEQQNKKEYAINQVLQNIPSEYANVIDRLKQIIPSVTRCDCVLEKKLKRKEQEYNKLKQILTDIEFWVRKFLKRTGQVVPNEIRQILQKISECEVNNAR